MSPQSIVCTTCGAAVSYGRLSCSACGELLASVSGAARPGAAGAVAGNTTTGLATPPVLTDDPPPSATDSPFLTEAEIRDTSPVAWPADQVTPDAAAHVWPEVAQTADPLRSVVAAPGAYVPPVLLAEPAGPPAPARAWAGRSAAHPSASKPGSPRSSLAGELLDAGRVTEFVGWLTVAGSAMAAVGFLLPWGISVIGASGVGYFDRWGLAGPFHAIVFISLLALLGLSLLRNPIPLWLRLGVPGLGLGALLLGLTWPYLVGLAGTGPGAMVVAIGALVLVVAGIGALASDRHGHEVGAV